MSRMGGNYCRDLLAKTGFELAPTFSETISRRTPPARVLLMLNAYLVQFLPQFIDRFAWEFRTKALHDLRRREALDFLFVFDQPLLRGIFMPVARRPPHLFQNAL